MPETRATFAVDLEGNVSTQANGIASSLEQLGTTIEDDLDSLKAMNGALRNLKQGGLANTETFKSLKDQIKAKQLVVGTSTKALIEMGGELKKSKKATEEDAAAVKRAKEVHAAAEAVTKKRLDATRVSSKQASEGMSKMVDSLKTASGSSGALASKASSLASALGAAGVAGAVVLAVAAFVALSAAMVVATVTLAGFALKAADARRAELLQLQGLEKMRTWFGLAGDKAGYMQSTIDKVSAKVATGRGKLIEYTRQLEMMGLRGKNLSRSLEAMAIVESVQGEQRAQLFANQAAGVALLGGSVDKLADRIKNKLGGIAAKRLLELSVITEKWQENLGRLFGDVKVEGFLGGLRTIVDLFGEGTESGRSLKVVVEAWLDPLFGSVSKGTPLIKRFFQGMILAAQELTIWMLDLRIGFQETFGGIKLGKLDGAMLALKGGKIAALGMVAALVFLGLALSGVVAAVVFMETAVPSMVIGMVLATSSLWDMGSKLNARFWQTIEKSWSYLKSLNWADLGKSLVDGFVAGIRSSAARAVGSIKDLAQWMKQAFTGEWKISSPSKVSAGYAKNIIEGHENETRRLGPRAARSMADAMSPDAVFGASGGAASSGLQRAAKLAQITIEQLVIQAHGPTVADIMAESRAQLTLILEQLLLELGANG